MTEIIIYEDPGATNPVQVTLDGETVWLTQVQMAELFDRDRTVIAKHVRNIFKEEELDPEATCAKFARVQFEGDRSVKRETEHYNLDVIISVGYRVKSPRGVRFRQWANSVLKDHLLKGYSLNRQRLGERGLEEAQAALDLLSRILAANALVDDTGQAVVALIAPTNAQGRACRHHAGRPSRFSLNGARPLAVYPSEVVGSMMVLTSVTLLAGKPPLVACSRTAASFSAMYTQ